MERERPDYLPAIRRSRWEFPWLLVIALVLLALVAAGANMLMRTNAAWAVRFQPRESAQPAPRIVDADAARQAELAEIRLRRVTAELKAKADAANSQDARPAEIRCISGTVFRRIPGGWENIPNRSC